MKIKVTDMPYEKVMALPRPEFKEPKKPNILFRSLMRALAEIDLKKVEFSKSFKDMHKAGDSPCLILMNHSSFIDLEIVSSFFYPKPYCIVCTSDGFVGKEWLMRNLGCIPTNKFVTDVNLMNSISTALSKGAHVLMYPEASYTFDGCGGTLPRRFGVLLKRLNVPVLMIKTEGAFAHDPLYNCLQKRKVKVSAELSCLLSVDEIKNLPTAELDSVIDKAFTFDSFRWQQENRIRLDEDFRADGLNRILYKCPHCGTEGETEGKGIKLICKRCNKSYTLDEYGYISADDGDSAFTHIPDWYAYERECVRREIENGTYRLDCDVDIMMMVDYKSIYRVGSGHLRHDMKGFKLTGCDGKLNYEQSPKASHGLYSDYYWYELGDIICIGNNDCLYYCFPKCGDVVAKTRLAAEELYKYVKENRISVKSGT